MAAIDEETTYRQENLINTINKAKRGLKTKQDTFIEMMEKGEIPSEMEADVKKWISEVDKLSTELRVVQFLILSLTNSDVLDNMWSPYPDVIKNKCDEFERLNDRIQQRKTSNTTCRKCAERKKIRKIQKAKKYTNSCK